MPGPVPTVGRIVHYTLSLQDADAVNRRRAEATSARASENPEIRPRYVAHVGNHASAGDVFPAMVVRVWQGDEASVQLQVFLDGNDTYWATSRREGTGPGTWSWPERV
ncbi:hypothetical protein [Streptomyces sp. NPDC018833]|uniref:hypothetical protein n=1 Tax=Streptomyces sp. NPDC018833 TaxID=3365053 RepID=UPI0037AC189C